MEIFQLAILCFIIYIMIYVLVDRICKCRETCAMYKTFGKHIDATKIAEIAKQNINKGE